MIPIVTFTGYSGSGKTTLVSSVIKELTQRDYKVASIKHDGHDHPFNMDVGKDSGRHRESGAVCSIRSNKSGFEMVCSAGRDVSPEELVSLMPAGTDIVICEGFKRSGLDKIEVVRKGFERANAGDHCLVAVASDDLYTDFGVPAFDINNPLSIAGFIEERYLTKCHDADLYLIVDGYPVPAKDFIRLMLTNSVRGMVQALKGCEDPKEIVIKAVYRN